MDHVRGSTSFATVRGSRYLVRSVYDPASRLRRQTWLGPRWRATEALRAFETGREEESERFAAGRSALERQAGVNRALGLGRVPGVSARILRALDDAGLLGRGLRVVGTHALSA